VQGEEGPREVLLVDCTAAQKRLGQRNGHLCVVGVRADAPARLDHLETRRDAIRPSALVRHPQRIAHERPEHGANGPISLDRGLRRAASSGAKATSSTLPARTSLSHRLPTLL